MNWQEHLIRRHPALFVRPFRAVPFAPGYPRCPDGWQRVVTRLVERVAATSRDGTVYFTHIIAEHGAMRVHWNSRSELTQRMALKIEEGRRDRRHAHLVDPGNGRVQVAGFERRQLDDWRLRSCLGHSDLPEGSVGRLVRLPATLRKQMGNHRPCCHHTRPR
jgi:hypothetical protein